jgi:glutamate synthase (NADPH/NADH)
MYLDKNTQATVEKEFNALATSLGFTILAWRNVPTDVNAIGAVALKSEPVSRQIFITANLEEEALKKQVVFYTRNV